MEEGYDTKALKHNEDNFKRDVLETLLKEYEFNNLSRMELFLWDLEIFLHIQEQLKDQIALKGGAAVQLYLPVRNQRTSVDIDMVCVTDKSGVEQALYNIEKDFDGHNSLFKFRLHKPKNPKTSLPLLTYYVDVPSVCRQGEIYGGRTGIQEVKVEFFMLEGSLNINRIHSPQVFALEESRAYQTVQLNELLGDKLTTLAVNTVGIPAERSDEYMKQVYDVDCLLRHRLQDITFDETRKHFVQKACFEAEQRNIKPNIHDIIEDIGNQMTLLSDIDTTKNDAGLRKLVDDFQSLYLRRTTKKSYAEWAATGSRLRFAIKCAMDSKGKELIGTLEEVEKKFNFEFVQGAKRKSVLKNVNETFLKEFQRHCNHPMDEFRGKHPQRSFWTVVSPSNIGEIASWVTCQRRFEMLKDAIISRSSGRVAGILNIIRTSDELKPFMELKGAELRVFVRAEQSRENNEKHKAELATIIDYFHAAETGGEIGIDINSLSPDQRQQDSMNNDISATYEPK